MSVKSAVRMHEVVTAVLVSWYSSAFVFMITTLRAFSIIAVLVVEVRGARGFLNRTLRIVVGACGDVMN